MGGIGFNSCTTTSLDTFSCLGRIRCNEWSYRSCSSCASMLTSVPGWSSNTLMLPKCPAQTAICKGVLFNLSIEFGSAPASKSSFSLSVLPLLAKECIVWQHRSPKSSSTGDGCEMPCSWDQCTGWRPAVPCRVNPQPPHPRKKTELRCMISRDSTAG